MFAMKINTRALLAVPALLALAACESSSRIGSLMPGGGYAAPQHMGREAPPPLNPAPVGDVQTTDLGGGVASSALPPPLAAPMTPSPMTPSPVTPSPVTPSRATGLGAPGNLGTAPLDPAPPPAQGAGSAYYPSVAGEAEANPSAAARVASTSNRPNRNAVIGNWSVSEAQGSICRITLSSAPKLDLYGAGTSGCQTKELQRVNAWELSGSELLLYEPGGGVVARLSASGSGYAGATARTGAPVRISK